MRRTVVTSFFALLAACAFGQNNNTANGYIPGHSYVSKDIDTVDLATGGVSINIPLLSFKEQDPVSIDYSLTYTSHHLAYVSPNPATGPENGWAWIDPMWLPSMPSAELVGGTATSYAGIHLTSNQDWRYNETSVVYSYPYPEIISPDGGTHVMLYDANGNLRSTDATGIAMAPTDGIGAGVPTYVADPNFGNTLGAEGINAVSYVLDASGVGHAIWMDGVRGGLVQGTPGSSVPLYLNRDYSNVPRIVYGMDGRPAHITDALNRQLPWADLFTGNIGPQITDQSKCVGTLPISQVLQVTFPNGTYLFCYTNIAVQTNFNPSQAFIPQYEETREFLQSVYLPNGRSWIFEYQDRDPGDSATINYGTLTKITYPTGGSVSYTYANRPECSYESNQGSGLPDTSRGLIERTETYTKGPVTSVASWSYIYTPGSYNTYEIPLPCDSPTDCQTTWQFTFNNDATVSVLMPDQSSVLHTFYQDATTCAGQELSTIEYDPNKKPLSEQQYLVTTTGYPVYVPRYSPTGYTQYYVGGSFSYAPIMAVKTLFPSGLSTATLHSYDQEPLYLLPPASSVCGQPTSQCLYAQRFSLGKEISSSVYDYGPPPAGSPFGTPTGSLLQQTSTTYDFQNNQASFNLNLLGLIDSKTVSNSGGTVFSQMTNTYATNSLFTYGASGNYESVPYLVTLTNSVAAISATSSVTTGYQYDANGNMTSVTDSNNHTTSYTYDQTGTFQTKKTFPSVNGLSLFTQTSYNSTGTVHSTSDENNNVTTYGYDEMLRLTSVVPPDTTVSGTVNLCYGEDITQSCTDASSTDPLNTVYARVSQNSTTGAMVRAKQSYDGFGRPYLSGYKDNTGWIDTQTGYDLLGRTQSVTMPYREGSAARGLSWTDYDAIGRVLDQKHEDSSGAVISQTSQTYTDDLVDIWDGDNHHSQHKTDALGRLKYVREPDVTNTPNLETDYEYDALGNLKSVNQKGLQAISDFPRTRQFTYDGLSRLTSAFNPETGSSTGMCAGTSQPWSICYTYDGVGNLQSKTDARGYVTQMSYDPLNRLLSKTYYSPSGSLDAGTPSTCFQYDLASLSNYKGQLATEWTQAGSCATFLQSVPVGSVFSSRSVGGYDLAGRITSETKCFLSQCYPSGTYNYDLVGNLLQYFNQNSTVSQSYDIANRLQSITAANPVTSQTTPLYSLTSVGPAGPLTINLGTSMTKIITYDSLQRKTSETTIKAAQ